MVDPPPHICFLAPNAFPMLANDGNIPFAGGAELQQVMIAKGLAQRGYQVSMICLDFGQEDRCEIDGVTVYKAFRPNSGIPVLRFIWPRLTSIWRCLKQTRADIYYQRAGSMLTGVMAAFCRQQGKRSIFAVAGESKFRFDRDRWLYEFGVKHVDRIVVQNAEQARAIRQDLGRDSVVIPNMYQVSAVTQGIATQSYVLWVGMIRQIKRPDLFLDLVQLLPDLRFVMVGGPGVGEAALYGEIGARAAELRNLDFVGFVPYQYVSSYFDGAMVFVNTSDSEGFPNTFLQSWARGVPTVSFIDSGAWMNGDPIGLLVNSIAEMAEVISSLSENDRRRFELGQVSKAYMELNHAPQRVLDLYDELFKNLMQRNVQE